jgi:hypothetical protein
MDRAKEPWTDAERESLCLAWRDPGWTRKDIAHSLRRSLPSVCSLAVKLKLGAKARPASLKKRWTAEEITRLRMLRDAGTMSLDAIAQQLGRTAPAIIHRAAIEGMPRKPYVLAVDAWAEPVEDGLRETPRMQLARALVEQGSDARAVIARLKLTALEAAELRKR